MITPTEPNWEALRQLAERVRLPAERVTLLRRRLEDTRAASPGRPYVLLVAEPREGLEMLLSHWISPEAATALEAAGQRPLILGPDAAGVANHFPGCASLRTAQPARGHVIALRIVGTPSASLLEELAALGCAEELLMVTRLSQPLNQHQRALAEVFAPFAATARALVVGLPGEAPGAEQLAALEAHTTNGLRQSGFRDGRCLGAGVWFTDSDASRPGALADPSRFFQVSDAEVAGGREGMLRLAVAELLREMRARCAEAAPSKNKPIAADEQARLAGELAGFLDALGRKAARKAATMADDDATLRAWIVDEMRGWGAYLEAEGAWMRYVDRLRPGAHAALLEEAAQAAGTVSAPARIVPQSGASASPPAVERLVVEAQRAGVGLGGGVAAYLLAGALPLGDGAFEALVRGAAFLCTAGIGYGSSRRWLRAPAHAERVAAPEPARAATAAPEGWDQFQRRLVAWFATLAGTAELSCAEQCEVIEKQWGLQISTP